MTKVLTLEDFNSYSSCTCFYGVPMDSPSMKPIDHLVDHLVEVKKIERPKIKTKKQTSESIQEVCCVRGCSGWSTNRNEKSLKYERKLKKRFIKRGWDKICNYHYFHDLYKYNKQKKIKREKRRIKFSN